MDDGGELSKEIHDLPVEFLARFLGVQKQVRGGKFEGFLKLTHTADTEGGGRLLVRTKLVELTFDTQVEMNIPIIVFNLLAVLILENVSDAVITESNLILREFLGIEILSKKSSGLSGLRGLKSLGGWPLHSF